MNENEYLELVNQLKDKYNEIEKREIEMKKKMQEIQKQLCAIYGLSRILDTFFEGLPPGIEFITGTIRSLLSDMIFKDLDEND